MSVHPIPAASLQRLRSVYLPFEQTAAVVAEAMGLEPAVNKRLDWDLGAFVVDEVAEPVVTNGVVASV